MSFLWFPGECELLMGEVKTRVIIYHSLSASEDRLTVFFGAEMGWRTEVLYSRLPFTSSRLCPIFSHRLAPLFGASTEEKVRVWRRKGRQTGSSSGLCCRLFRERISIFSAVG